MRPGVAPRPHPIVPPSLGQRDGRPAIARLAYAVGRGHRRVGLAVPGLGYRVAGHAVLDQLDPDRVGAPLAETDVVPGRAGEVGVAVDLDGDRSRPSEGVRRLPDDT